LSFRRRLLAVFALTIFLSVGVVSWIISLRTRSTFERAEAERTDALVTQFRREFDRRAQDVVRRVDTLTASDSVSRMALDLAHGADYSAYVTEARSLAQGHQLDLLELIGSDGAIISSAQWPARFGYKEEVVNRSGMLRQGAFLRPEPLPDGTALGLVALRVVRIGDKPLYLLGGERLDRNFLSSLTLPAGMRVLLYRNLQPEFASQALIDENGVIDAAEKLAPIVQQVQRSGGDASAIVQWSSDSADTESFHAMPLKGDNDALLGVLLIGSSRRGLVELQRHIGAFALMVGGAGVLLAILLSGWIAARVTTPIERLAEAARQVAAGNWETHVDSGSRDEIGELATSFNSMMRQLNEQRGRLVQSERVAAWRELARRLAHELKNPLFPLQITVENLLRARLQTPEQFDEVFRESTATLLAELGNLKAIISRFSDFSKMPQPQLQRIQVNDLVRQLVKLHEAQLRAPESAPVEVKLALDESLPTIDADPELLHRALSNLVLNALDAMPQGGTLTVHTRTEREHVRVEISDTGAGLTREECDRLFTPYYTTKQHGTGLGLAIVQSVVSDHKGSIAVHSVPGQGTTFRIDLPRPTSHASAATDMFKSAVIS